MISLWLLTRDWRTSTGSLGSVHVASQLSNASLDARDAGFDGWTSQISVIRILLAGGNHLHSSPFASDASSGLEVAAGSGRLFSSFGGC